MNRENFPLEHVYSLLADRALQGADAAEEAGLRCLLSHYPEMNAETFDYAAAALDLAFQKEEQESLPVHLLTRLQVQAAAFTPEKHVPAPAKVEPVPAPSPRPNPRANSTLTWVGWLVAATLLFAVVVPSKPPQLSYSKLKDRGALVVAGSVGPHGNDKLQGEFVWDSNTQQGFMKLTGFEVNDPAVKQYQLWIIDDKPFTVKEPIDGGVFNVTSNKEVLIPIKPNLKVGKAALFAITVEKPGGVMVSKRDPMIFVGAVPAPNRKS
ncbi:MAG TPA: anti-sigma factor [Gemmatales bacterium]|nr:anti-sigma factor [Gemmatales bacterium]